MHDITDWVAATRIKSAHLLYTLMLNEGDNVTQHLEKVLGGMYRAATDDETEVVKYVSFFPFIFIYLFFKLVKFKFTLLYFYNITYFIYNTHLSKFLPTTYGL